MCTEDLYMTGLFAKKFFAKSLIIYFLTEMLPHNDNKKMVSVCVRFS